jgi:Fe-S-cluster containining protein
MEIGRNDTCPCGSGKKYKKCCDISVRPTDYAGDEITVLKFNKWIAYKGKVGRERAEFCDSYIKNKSLVLKAIKEKQLEETQLKGETVSCQPGCVYCCYHYVTATLDETEAIVYYLYQNEKYLNNFLTAYRRWKAKIDENTTLMTDILRAYNTSITDHSSAEKQESFRSLANQYLSLDIPCPFLNDGACSIYPVRPWVCACFVAVTPIDWCRPDSPNKPRTMSMTYYNEMDKIAHYRKFKGIWTTMPSAVYSILKSGVYTLSKIPGLEALEKETMEDPEIKSFLRSLRVI